VGKGRRRENHHTSFEMVGGFIIYGYLGQSLGEDISRGEESQAVFSPWHRPVVTRGERCLSLFLFVCLVLGLELRVYTLSHSTSPFL
jgi:hypothetical protein